MRSREAPLTGSATQRALLRRPTLPRTRRSGFRSPSSSSPSGCISVPTAPRVKARAVTASVPSTSARTSTTASTCLPRDEGEKSKDDRLDEVDHAERAPQAELIQTGCQGRREEGRDELGGGEQGGRRDGAPCLVIDEQRKGDDTHGVAQFVDRVGAEQAPERSSGQSVRDGPPHPILVLYAGISSFRRVRMSTRRPFTAKWV